MLVTGSDAHVRQAQVGIQTDEPRFEVSWMTITAIMCMVVLIVFTGWSLEPMHKDTAWTWSQNMWKYLNALLVTYTAYVHISMCMMSRRLAKLCERVGTPDDNNVDEPDENDDDTAEMPEAIPQEPPVAHGLPNPILVTPTGHCYHSPGCHTIGRRSRRLRPCMECLG